MKRAGGAWRRLDGIYPGWWVVAACCFLAVFPGAIFSYVFPVFSCPFSTT